MPVNRKELVRAGYLRPIGVVWYNKRRSLLEFPGKENTSRQEIQ